MRRSIPLAVPAVLALAFFAAPTSAVAQEYEAQEKCMASFQPAAIHAGQPAVALTADLSADIGAVTEIKAPEESGVMKAALADVEAVAMDVPAEQVEEPAVEMAAEGNQAEVWLSTVGASAGTYKVELTGDAGSCWGEITVEAEEGTGTEESDEAGQSN